MHYIYVRPKADE